MMKNKTLSEKKNIKSPFDAKSVCFTVVINICEETFWIGCYFSLKILFGNIFFNICFV